MTRMIVITGADGFVGLNLQTRLRELGDTVVPITRQSGLDDWRDAIRRADAIVHLAGANRPADPAEFMQVNDGMTGRLVEIMRGEGRRVPILYASSARAGEDSEYGRSKRSGEKRLQTFAEDSGVPVFLYRLPNVFGKWARPDYNSAVATFCHRVARDLPVTIHDPASPLTLVYIDDVVDSFCALLEENMPVDAPAWRFVEVAPAYRTTVGEVADTIAGFRRDRSDNLIDAVGTGLVRALYATYVASLPPQEFSYSIQSHRDPRGAFSEMLKTRTSGQFSYFTALPGVTRGGHYHHTKTEKFLIVHGRARFGFRHVVTGETHEILTSGEAPVIVETVPGWAHDVTNIGEDVMVSLLWANELFDRERPDTIVSRV